MSSEQTLVAMPHDEAFGELGALALDALSPAERGRVQAHVRTCQACTAELNTMREALARMPQEPAGAPPLPRNSGDIRYRLVERADTSLHRSRPAHLRTWLGVAAAVAFVVTGAAYLRERSARAELARTVGTRDATISSLVQQLRTRESELATLVGPTVSVVELTATGARPPSAKMFWDRASNRWTLFAHGLTAPPPGRAYELWLVTADDRKIPAGTFKPRDDGSAVHSATYALRAEDLKAIAITEEPEAGVPAPTGPVILAGAAD